MIRLHSIYTLVLVVILTEGAFSFSVHAQEGNPFNNQTAQHDTILNAIATLQATVDGLANGDLRGVTLVLLAYWYWMIRCRLRMGLREVLGTLIPLFR